MTVHSSEHIVGKTSGVRTEDDHALKKGSWLDQSSGRIAEVTRRAKCTSLMRSSPLGQSVRAKNVT